MSSKLDMNRAVCFHALLGLFAGSIFSSWVCVTPMNFVPENDCNLLGSIEKSLITTARITYHGFLILAIKFLHYLSLRSVDLETPAPYTMLMPFWVAFTLLVSSMSELSFN